MEVDVALQAAQGGGAALLATEVERIDQCLIAWTSASKMPPRGQKYVKPTPQTDQLAGESPEFCIRCSAC